MAINLYKLHFLSPIFFSEPNKKVFHLSNKKHKCGELKTLISPTFPSPPHFLYPHFSILQ